MEKEYLFVITSGILSGFVVFGAGLFSSFGLSLYQLSLFQALFVFLLLPFVLFKKECRIEKRMLKFFVVFGFLALFSNFTEFGPVFLGVPVAVVVLLMYTQPIWTIIIGKLFLKEVISRKKILSLLLAIAGVVVLINPVFGAEIGSWLGILLALAGGLTVSAWVVLGRVAGIKGYHPITTLFGHYIFMILFLLIFYPFLAFFVKDSTIVNLSPDIGIGLWAGLLVFSVFAIFLNQIIYFYGAKKVLASDAGIILLLEPVVATLLAMVFLQQPITANILAGGALILAANYIVIYHVRKSG